MLLQSLFLAAVATASTFTVSARAAANSSSSTWFEPKKVRRARPRAPLSGVQGASIVYAINDASLPKSLVTKSGLKLNADIYIVDVRRMRPSRSI